VIHAGIEMKRVSLVSLLTLVVFFCGSCFRRFPAKYTDTQQLSLPLSSGGTLHVSTQNGWIAVHPGDVEEVQITAHKTVRSRTIEEAEQFCKETQIETETDASGATVRVVLPQNYRGRANIAVSIEAVVPKKSNLDLNTSNGRIEVEAIDGNVEMETSNGRIVAKDIAGNILADTSNGSVHLEDVSGSAQAGTSNGKVIIQDAAGDIRAHTSNGSIRLHNVAAGADAVTSNGSVTCSLPGDASATVYASTSNGRIRCDFPLNVRRSRASGKIADGKHTISLRTTNGSISIKRIK
jgi:DUF4097 and DUF4098 domain-containing protein YvlB